MYRVPSIAVLLAATAFPPSLEGQMRAIQRPIAPARISMEPHFRAMPLPPAGSGVIISPHRPGRQGLFVGGGTSPHHFRSNVFLGNSCFTNPFWNPVFCQQFFFPDRFLFAEPLFLPYPVTTAPYYQAAEQTEAPSPELVVVQAAPAPPQASQPAPEPVLLEWNGDRWLRLANNGQSALGTQPNHLRPSKRKSNASASDLGQTRGELPSAVLVFRDGHKEEVSSYTIVGETMYTKADYWTTGSWTKKVQLGDLDLPATLSLNKERGVKFALPAGPHEVIMR